MFNLVSHLLPSCLPADLIIRQCCLFVCYFFPFNDKFHGSYSMIKFKDWHLLARKYSNPKGTILTHCKRTCSYVQTMVVLQRRRVTATHILSALARDSPEPCIACTLLVNSWAEVSFTVTLKSVLTHHFCPLTHFMPCVNIYLLDNENMV